MPAAFLENSVVRLLALLQEGEEESEAASEAALKFLGVQAIDCPQAQHHPLHVPVHVRDAVVFRQHGGALPDAPDVARQIFFVGVPHAAEVGVGAGAEPGVLAQRPVFQVVAGLPACPGEVGNFVLLVAVAGQIVRGIKVHIGLGLVSRQVGGIPTGVKGRPFLHLQSVAAQMLRRQIHGGGEVFLPPLHGLPRQAVDEV